jgi:hypothetical protein
VSRYLSVTTRKSQGFQAGAFNKEWTGIFREYAIPPQFLDRERVTQREGDERLVL